MINSKSLFVTVILLLLLPLSLYISTVGASGNFDHFYLTCQATPVSSQLLWTPIIIVASPYGGNATGSSSVYSWGSFTFAFAEYTSYTFTTQHETTNEIGASNGEVVGLFELDNWTIYKLQTVSAIGIGNNNPCAASYTAQLTAHSNYKQTYTLLPCGSKVDSNIPQSFSMTDNQNHQVYSSVILPSLDYTTDQGGVGTCNSVGVTQSVTASQWITGSIGISISGYSVSGSLAITQGSGNSVTFTYTFPKNGVWTWTYLSGQASPGLAFNYAPCS